MPVKHDLYADLHITKDDVARLRSQDPRLNQLIDKYEQIDTEIVKAESGAAGELNDEALKKLKEQRLAAKDSITDRLGSPD